MVENESASAGTEADEDENHLLEIIGALSLDPTDYLDPVTEKLLDQLWRLVPTVPEHATCGSGVGRSYTLWSGDRTIKSTAWTCKRHDHQRCAERRAKGKFPLAVDAFKDYESCFVVTFETAAEEIERFRGRIRSARYALKDKGIHTVALALSHGPEKVTIISNVDLLAGARVEPKTMQHVVNPLRLIATEILRPGVSRIQRVDSHAYPPPKIATKKSTNSTPPSSPPIKFVIEEPWIQHRMMQLLDQEVYVATGQNLSTSRWDMSVPDVFDETKLPKVLLRCRDRAESEYNARKGKKWKTSR